jgi:penicillin G amidase
MLRKIFLFIVLVIAGLGFYGYWYLQQTKPIYEGEIKLAGLSNPVKVKYDNFGIPHIYAKNESDAYFALGYLQAQERLFQMEMIRRVATGTLAEILGAEFVDVDKLFRTLGFAKKSDGFAKVFAEYDPVYKQAVLSYFEGLNAYVDNGPTPIEFTLIGIPKRRFSVTDAYNAAAYMAFGFADGFRVDPLTSKIAGSLGMKYLDDIGLHSIYDSTYLKSYFEPASIELTALNTIIDKLPMPLIDGSNSWIIAPKKSASGKPIIENDTHIGFSQPSVWFEAHLEYPGTSLYGHYLAGFPFAILGHNKFAAVGMTMFENDDVDLFQEKANPDEPNQVWRIDHWQDLISREEVIDVKDEKPIKISIRESFHGPIINDVLLKEGATTEPVAVWWAYLHADKDLLEPMYALYQASNMIAAREAAAKIQAPGLNIMYADIDGNIAWWAAARIPIRPEHVNSKLLLDGSSGKDDYLGYYDFSHNPQAENPPWNYLYSANNQPDTVKGVLYPGYYRPLDRASKIVNLVESKDDWTATQVQQMTANVTSPVAPLVAKEMARVLKLSKDPEIVEISKLLMNWDGDHQQTSIEPTVYYNLLSWVLYYAMADELGYDDFKSLINSEVMKRSYLQFVGNENSVWWDDISTTVKESKEEIISWAGKSALSTLKNSTGSASSDGWVWSKVHTVTHSHPLGKVALLKKYFDVGPLTTNGGNEVINNMVFKLDTTGYFPVYMGPAVRTVIDMGNIDGAMSINPTGQSGNFLSEHYDDQAQMFVDVKFRPQLMGEEDIEENKSSELTLLPKNN